MLSTLPKRCDGGAGPFFCLPFLNFPIDAVTFAVMCQMISPERMAIWSALFDERFYRVLSVRVEARHFEHPTYRRWYQACAEAYAANKPVTIRSFLETDEAATAADRRALTRMIKVSPPPRVRANIDLLAAALVDKAEGRAVDLRKLQN